MCQIEKLEGKYFIKEEMSKETYEKFLLKYRSEEATLRQEIEKSAIGTSNHETMLKRALNICLNLPKLWALGAIGLKEKIQKLIFPSGLVYDKKNGVLRTEILNEAIVSIARLSGDLAKMKKGLPPFYG